MRERGLKYPLAAGLDGDGLVAPHAGAWIEIPLRLWKAKLKTVAPHAGAWIEILNPNDLLKVGWQVAPHAGAWIEMIFWASLRARGLPVAPHAGAWIEMGS